MNKVTVANSQEIFISRCRAKDLAKGTILWYGQILRPLVSFLAARGTTDLLEVKATDLRDFMSNLRAGGHGSETVFRTWGALKAVFRFFLREGLISANPMELVERPCREKRRIQPLNMAQVQALLSIPDSASTNGLRDRAMILLMVDSGLRLSEVLTLDMNRIYWDERQAIVLGKGRKERSIPLGQQTIRALRDYLSMRGPGGGVVFLGRGSLPLNRRTVQLQIRKYGAAAKITGVRMSPHTLRHSFAIQWIRNGGDPFSLQSILGHSTLEMVRNYVNLASCDVSIQHQKFSPIDRILSVSPSHDDFVKSLNGQDKSLCRPWVHSR